MNSHLFYKSIYRVKFLGIPDLTLYTSSFPEINNIYVENVDNFTSVLISLGKKRRFRVLMDLQGAV